MDADPPQPTVERPELVAVNAAISALLERHGIDLKRRKHVLETILGLEQPQIGRRLRNEVPWAVQDLAKIASHFGEPVYKWVGSMIDGVGQAALLRMGGVSLPCSVWLGDEIRPNTPRAGPLVAFRSAASEPWTVVTIGESAGTAFDVLRVVVEPHSPRRVVVADDDDEVSSSIVTFLRMKGLDAVSFKSAERVRTALDTSTFDGFILDWVFDHATSKDLLAAIRSKNPASPIAILTAHLAPGGPHRAELEDALALYRATLYEKPAHPLELLSFLESRSDASRSGT